MNSFISRSSSKSATTIAVASFAYFVVAVTALNLLNPSYGLSVSMYGGYDFGSYEFLIASTFFALGLGSLALTLELFQAVLLTVQSRIGLLLLGIWGLGIFLAGIFPANEPGSTVPHMTTVLIAGIFPVEVEAYPETGFSFMHIFVILGSFLNLTFAAILLSLNFKKDEMWRHFHFVSLILALVMLVALIFSIPLFFSQLLTLLSSFNIMFNPMFFAMTGVNIGIIWLIFTSIRLRHIVINSV